MTEAAYSLDDVLGRNEEKGLPLVLDADETQLYMRVHRHVCWAQSSKKEVVVAVLEPMSKKDIPHLRKTLYEMLSSTNHRYGQDLILNVDSKEKEAQTYLLFKCKKDTAVNLLQKDLQSRLREDALVAIYVQPYEPVVQKPTPVPEKHWWQVIPRKESPRNEHIPQHYHDQTNALIYLLDEGLAKTKKLLASIASPREPMEEPVHEEEAVLSA